MAKSRNQLSKPSTISAKVNVSRPRTRVQTRDEHRDEELNRTDRGAPSSSSVKSNPQSTTKTTSLKSDSTQVPATNSAITSSAESTPQPAQGAKRKGGNKRKWTHEYCLTCTRYGRACGGRREGEDGCSVCRNPDKAKGEKLRECLWADPEAGIDDYKTAREVFKRNQAHFRAQRAKPTGNGRRQSVALSAVAKLPQTTKPLDLLPPTRDKHHNQPERPAVTLGDVGETVLVEQADGAADTLLPRIHAPQLTYVNLDSDDGGKITASSRNISQVVAAQQEPRLHIAQTSNHTTSHYGRPVTASVSSKIFKPLTYDNPLFHQHTYRSAYDAVPVPSPQLIGRSWSGRLSLSPSTHQHFPAPAPAPAPASLRSSPQEQSASPPRKWSKEGSDIVSVAGYKWKPKGWKPAEGFENGKGDEGSGLAEHMKRATGNRSGTSSLSSYVSIDEETPSGSHSHGRFDPAWTKIGAKDSAAGLGNEEGGNRNRLNAQITDVNHEMANYGRKSQRRDTLANETAHADASGRGVGREDLNAVNFSGVSSSAEHDANDTLNGKDTAFMVPGEITIQEDEDMGTDDSDSDLTSDEGKLKSLPSKLRKVLSRSRITKVIIGDDVFEIRPKVRAAPARIVKPCPNTADERFNETSSQKRKRVSGILPTESKDETEDAQVTGSPTSVPLRENGIGQKPAPLRIKLIFNRKSTADTSKPFESSSSGSGEVNTSSIQLNDVEMNDL